MTVVLGPGWPGILLHEAIGHGLEGDFNRKGTSAFAGRIGERVASELCTIVDDGTLSRRRGSLNIDDEGTPTQCTTLIENGVLKGYLQDKMNARLTGTAVHRQRPPRVVRAHHAAAHDQHLHAPGQDTAGKKSSRRCEKGIYAVNFGGGQVDITSGKFVFSASEAYLIENGKIGAPIKGATLIGNGPDVLTRVSMVGNDLKLGRRRRHLRHGRAECAGRCRTAYAAHRRASLVGRHWADCRDMPAAAPLASDACAYIPRGAVSYSIRPVWHALALRRRIVKSGAIHLNRDCRISHPGAHYHGARMTGCRQSASAFCSERNRPAPTSRIRPEHNEVRVLRHWKQCDSRHTMVASWLSKAAYALLPEPAPEAGPEMGNRANEPVQRGGVFQNAQRHSFQRRIPYQRPAGCIGRDAPPKPASPRSSMRRSMVSVQDFWPSHQPGDRSPPLIPPF